MIRQVRGLSCLLPLLLAAFLTTGCGDSDTVTQPSLDLDQHSSRAVAQLGGLDDAPGGGGASAGIVPAAGKPKHKDKFKGQVTSADPIGHTLTLNDGTVVRVDGGTRWKGGGSHLGSVQEVADALLVGDEVRAHGKGGRQDDGSILAREIKAKAKGDKRDDGRFRGRAIFADPSAQTLTLDDGTVVSADLDTRWKGGAKHLDSIADIADALDHGAEVRIKGKGTRQADGSILAREIKAKATDVVFEMLFKDELDALDELIERIGEIAEENDLTGGQANSLVKKLSNAAANLSRGKVNGALGKLGAFISEVDAYVTSGKLDAEDGAELIEDAQAIIDGINAKI